MVGANVLAVGIAAQKRGRAPKHACERKLTNRANAPCKHPREFLCRGQRVGARRTSRVSCQHNARRFSSSHRRKMMNASGIGAPQGIPLSFTSSYRKGCRQSYLTSLSISEHFLLSVRENKGNRRFPGLWNARWSSAIGPSRLRAAKSLVVT